MENNFDAQEYEDKMTWKPDNIKFQTEPGVFVSYEESQEYFKNHPPKTTVETELKVGDVVKIFDLDTPLIVIMTKETEKNNELIGFKYSGGLEMNAKERLLFNQSDIERIIEIKKNEETQLHL